MRLRHLRVRNIRSYAAGTIDFPDGTTLISGDVGAGKTSLLYAVEMALFGTSEVDAAYLVRHGAAHAEVDVTFEDAEHSYRIARRFRRVRRKGRETYEPEAISFSVDGAKTEYSATELRQRVIELLGFPDNPNPVAHSDLWRWAVYVPQERMRDILGARPQDRLETVRKALGVERYRTAADNAQELGADLRRSATARRAAAERLRYHDEEFARWTAEADRTRVERSAVDAAIEQRRAAVEEVRVAVGSHDAAVRQTEADRRELESLLREDEADLAAVAERTRVRSERLAAADAQRAVATSAEDDAARLVDRRRALDAADDALRRARGEIEANSGQLRALIQARADLASAVQRRDEATEAVARTAREREAAAQNVEARAHEGPTHEPPAPTPESLEEIDARLEGARTKERESLTSLTRAETALHEFEELLAAGVCPRCGQTVRGEEFQRHRAEADVQARAARDAQAKAVADRTQIEEERRARERYERARGRWREVEQLRDAARRELARAEDAERGATEALGRASEAIREAHDRVDRLGPAEATDAELRARVERISMERARATELVEHAATAAERLRAARAAAELMSAEAARIAAEIEASGSRIESRRLRLSALEESLRGADARSRELDAARQRLATGESALEEERRTLVRIDSRLDEAVRRVSDAERGRAERSQLVAEADDLERKATWISGPFRKAVLSMEQRLLAHAQAAFERSLTRYFAALIDDPALVARTDVAFTPAVAIEGEWTPAEALSGGERTSLALAFRLALAEVVRSLGNLHLDTILLDEPTDGFSPEQVVRMGELLDTLALPQVILVSHEDELAGIADRVVRIEKIDGKSVLRAPAAGGDASPRVSAE